MLMMITFLLVLFMNILMIFYHFISGLKSCTKAVFSLLAAVEKLGKV